MNKKYAGLDFPAWFDGKDVNEAAFCREFLSKNKLIYADNAFFTPDGRLTDPLLLLKEKIYAELECCAAKNILRTISNIVKIMKLVVHAESFPPNPDEIHVQNGTLRIDGSFLAGRSEIVRSRFPIDYNPQAGKSVVWLRFLSDLLYPEDIPTFQEYIGYCLVPSTKGQRMMILKGEGGEGKSQIGPVLARLFGCNMKDGSIAKISDNRFARADLEHIHLLVDDDMKMVVIVPVRLQLDGCRRQQRSPVVNHDPAADLHGDPALIVVIAYLIEIQPLGHRVSVYPQGGKEHGTVKHLHQLKAFFSCINRHTVFLLSFSHRFPDGRKPPAVDPPDLIAQALCHTGHIGAGGGAAV